MGACPYCGNSGAHKLSCPTRIYLDPEETELALPEADPNGKSAHESGSKLDAGKADAELVFEGFPRALLAVAEVATFGALKYTRGGWKEVPNGIQRYDAAHMRHKLKRLKGEKIDPDSKKWHRAHEVWNALAALELELTQEETK